MYRIGQVTIGTTATSLQTAIAASVAPGSSPKRTPVYWVFIQNNSGHDIRVGDSTASVSGNIGTLLKTGQTPPASHVIGPFTSLSFGLEQVFIAGTQNDIIDFAFVK